MLKILSKENIAFRLKMSKIDYEGTPLPCIIIKQKIKALKYYYLRQRCPIPLYMLGYKLIKPLQKPTARRQQMFHSTMSSLLCTFLIFLGLTSAVFAFQCYECNSVAEPKCLEELDVWTPPLVNCAAETCFKIFAEVGDVTTVIKGCWIPGADPTGTCKTRDSAGCYLCESDKCNSATDLKAFVLLGLVAACLLYLL